VPLQHDGVIEVGNGKVFRVAVVTQKYPAADVGEPGGMIGIARPSGTAHHAKRKPLSRLPGFFQYRIEKRNVDLARLRLKRVPPQRA